MEKVQKLRNSVEQDDASVFTKTGKLKSGQEFLFIYLFIYPGASNLAELV